MGVRATRILDSLRRAFRRHRRGFAALLATVAVLAALNSLSPRATGLVTTVVAARSVAGGSTLDAEDLELLDLPSAAVADGAFSEIRQLVGQTVVATVPRRRVLTTADLVGADGQLAAGKLALPVRFGEPAFVSLLRAGSRIDVLGSSTDGATYGVVAGEVRVVAIPAAADSGIMGGSQAPLVLLEVSSAQAAAIAGAAAVSSLSFALR